MIPIVKPEELAGRLTHWIPERFAADALKGDFNGGEPYLGHGDKPAGLWIDWDLGFQTFSAINMPGALENRIRLEVALAPGLCIFRIDGPADISATWDRYLEENGMPDRDMVDMDSACGLPSYFRSPFFWEWIESKGIDGIALSDEGFAKSSRIREGGRPIGCIRGYTFTREWDSASIVIFRPWGKVAMQRDANEVDAERMKEDAEKRRRELMRGMKQMGGKVPSDLRKSQKR